MSLDAEPNELKSEPAGHDEALELAAEAILREHPDALACALASDGLITPVPKSVGLWGQAALEGRALIDHVIANDRKAVLDSWQKGLREGHSEAKVRLTSAPNRWMNLHFIDLRPRHGVIVGVVIPTDELSGEGDEVAAEQGTEVRFATLIEDESGTVLDCDDAFKQMLGYDSEDVIGKSVLDQIHADDQGRAVEGWLAMLATRRIQQARLRRRRKDGSWIWVDTTMHNFLHQPDRGYVLVELIDVSAEMAAQEAVQEREELLRRLMDTMPDGVMQVDRERNVVFHNARLGEILQLPAAGASGADGAPAAGRTMGPLLATLTEASNVAFHLALAKALADGADDDVEVDFVAGDGEWRRALMSIRALLRHATEVNGAIVTVLDVTDSVRARQELERRATYDALTHCLNRTSILAALQTDLTGPSRNEIAVVYADLDHFKEVNDTFGHAAGDEVLIQVVERLRKATRGDDRIGRLGGDEFLILIRGLPEPQVAIGVAMRISEALCQPLAVAGGELQMKVSMGVAHPGEPGISAEELVARADRAMYESKQARQGLPVLSQETGARLRAA